MIFKKIFDKWLIRLISLGILGSAIHVDFNHCVGNFSAPYILLNTLVSHVIPSSSNNLKNYPCKLSGPGNL